MKLSYKQILIILLVSIFIVSLVILNNNKQKKMIKMDACVSGCSAVTDYSGAIMSGYFKNLTEDKKCKEKCREKYGTTWLEYDVWKEKNNSEFDIP